MSYPQQDFPALSAANLRHARLYADRKDLVRSFDHIRHGIVAEVGVALGEFSGFLMEELQPAQFVAFDTFDMHESPSHWGVSSSVLFGGLSHQDFFRKKFSGKSDIVVLEPGRSHDTLPLYPERYFDLIYVDAGHTYEDVKRDADIAKNKLKEQGVLVFNDYVMFDHMLGVPYGVVQAVNELVTSEGWCVVGFALQQHMFCDIAVQRGSPAA